MKIYCVFVLGFIIGSQMNNPRWSPYAKSAGTWTRLNVFGLAPINNESNDGSPNV